MSVVVRRIDAILDSLPTEGKKAAMLRGVITSIGLLVETAQRAVEMINCLGQARGVCSETYCNPSCARIYLVKNGGTHIIKIGGNAMGVHIDDYSVRVTAEDREVEVRSDGTLRLRIPGLEEEINLADQDETFREIYLIRYVLKPTRRALENIVENLRRCALANAIVC